MGTRLESELRIRFDVSRVPGYNPPSPSTKVIWPRFDVPVSGSRAQRTRQRPLRIFVILL